MTNLIICLLSVGILIVIFSALLPEKEKPMQADPDDITDILKDNSYGWKARINADQLN